MSKPGIVIAVLAALGVGWFLGSTFGGRGDGGGVSDEVAALREANARLRLALGERSPAGDGSQAPSMGGGSEVLPPPPASYAPTDRFDVTTFDHPDRAFQAFLAYAATMLDRGAEGHGPLLQTISATFFEPAGKKHVAELVGGEVHEMRYHYPLLRFVMNREDQVAELTETVFRTMAEEPKRFDGLHDDLLALFTEDAAPLLPGVVGAARLERFRAYARTILGTDRAAQPVSVQRRRADVQAVLASWQPRMTPEEAFQRLQQAELSPEEGSALLRQIARADIARLDVDRVLGPLIEQDPWTVIGVLGRAELDAGMIDRLDARIIQGVVAGRLKQAVVHYWLRYTGRGSFEDAKPFLERGLQAARKDTAGTFLLTALALRPPPAEDWIQWAEQRFEFSDEVRLALLRMRERNK